MTHTSITNLRKDIFATFEQAVRYNEPISVSTKDGTAIIISEEDYNGLMETLAIVSVPGLKDSIVAGMNAPLSECVGEDCLEW